MKKPESVVIKKKKFRVPNFDVEIKSHELLVFNTQTFQRLFRLNQLGLAYTIYPFATHTRAAHAIETLNYAQKIIDSLLKNGEEINDETVDLIRMSALLHDIAHIPFSHTLEDENIVFHNKHDNKVRLEIFISKIRDEIVKPGRPRLSLLEPKKEDWETSIKLLDQVKKVLRTISEDKYADDKDKDSEFLEKDRFFIADIVGNTISADLLAYIRRDVDFTGIEKLHGGYRIFDYLKTKIDKDGCKRIAIELTKAGFRIDVLSAILDVLDVRYALMERVVFHHAKCAASAMLAKAARLVDLKEEPNLYTMGDEIFLSHLSEKAKRSKMITDEDRDGISHLIKRINSRIFYKRIYRVTYRERIEYDKTHSKDFCSLFRKPAETLKFEREVETQFKLKPGTIAIFCPKADMHLKEAKVMVDWGKECVHSLNSEKFKDDYKPFWERVNQIEEKYKDLWNFYVFIEPDEFGKVGLIQNYLYEKLKLKNDPLLDLYLEQKPEYIQSKKFANIATTTSYDIQTDALDALLHKAAWEKEQEPWGEEECKTALKVAMREHSKEVEKKKIKSKQMPLITKDGSKE